MRASDYLIDIGPGAGSRGGIVVAHGTPRDVAQLESSLTGGYLSGGESIPLPTERRKPAKTRMLQITGATSHNLQNVDVDIPLGLMVCVTGVSGSGKSSLVVETLARALARKLNGAEARPAPHQSLRGVSQLDRLVEIDQSPIGRTPRSQRGHLHRIVGRHSRACSPARSRHGSAATASADSASTPRAAAAKSAKGRACGGSP